MHYSSWPDLIRASTNRDSDGATRDNSASDGNYVAVSPTARPVPGDRPLANRPTPILFPLFYQVEIRHRQLHSMSARSHSEALDAVSIQCDYGNYMVCRCCGRRGGRQT